MNTQIYKNKDEWYHPEIPYAEMLDKFRMTENILTKSMLGVPVYKFPLPSVSFIEYSGAFERVQEGKDQQMFQFWNKEFNDELQQAITHVAGERKLTLILDVCAGDGTLAKILSNRGFTVKAVDNYEWPFKKRYFDVEKLDYREALKKYRPDFVIGCWMPLYSDWTSYFRRIKSVKHYLFIGEGDGGCTGGNWDEHKGWKMEYHQTEYGVCRTDVIWSFNEQKVYSGLKHTQVYSFSRL